MLRKVIAVAAVILLIFGCGHRKTEALAVGRQATLADGAGRPVRVKLSGKTGDGIEVFYDAEMPPGTRVLIVGDGPSRGLVKVRVEEGAEKGRVGDVDRDQLRPIR